MRVGFVVTNCHCEVGSILGSLLGLQLTIHGYVIAMDYRRGGGSKLSLSSGYTTYYAAVIRVGFVVTSIHNFK